MWDTKEYDLHEIEAWLVLGWELNIKSNNEGDLEAHLAIPTGKAPFRATAPCLDTLLLTLSSTLQGKEE